LQQYLFGTLPGDLGFESQPSWWPVPLLALSGLRATRSLARART